MVAFADEQPLGRLAVGGAVGDEREHLAFAFAERAVGRAAYPAHETARDRR
jgi:hypothetical protein